MTHPLSHYRAAHELTLEAFGDLVGATKGMVSKWEAGRAMPRRQYLARISEVTNGAVTAADFVNVAVSRDMEAAE